MCYVLCLPDCMRVAQHDRLHGCVYITSLFCHRGAGERVAAGVSNYDDKEYDRDNIISLVQFCITDGAAQ